MAELNTSGFLELDHTADWALRVWAPDLAGLFREAARGMYALMDIRMEPGLRVEHDLRIQAADAESLLVSFLSELLFTGEQEGLAFDCLDLTVEPTELYARMQGGQFAQQRKEIKAVTYHNLAIRKTDRGLEVTIVFDV